MTNMRLTWDLPNVSIRQAPIQHTVIDFRVDPTLPWAMQDTVAAAAVQELLFVDIQPGSYFYRATVVDADGVSGAPVETQATVAFDPPGIVTNLTATEE